MINKKMIEKFREAHGYKSNKKLFAHAHKHWHHHPHGENSG
jgi:hypothetical protein